MKRVVTADSAGKPLKIAVLTDWDLLYCIPYTLLSCLYRVTRVGAYLAFRLATAPVLALFKRCNVSLTWSLVLFPCMIAVASAITTTAGAFSLADLASALALLLFGATLLADIISIYFHLEDARFEPELKLSLREAATVARLRADAASLPDDCVGSQLDKSILVIGFVRTLLVLPALVCAVLLPPSWLCYALMAYVALFVFNDFETIEHIASHATAGRLLLARKAPWWARSTEFLRRHVVWPLFGWFPDMYFVTHAMHHHVENNGPADWQSTLRYDRTSILDFTKSVTWIGINLLLPVDTLSYVIQRRRFRLLRLLVKGLLVHVLLMAAVALFATPLFAMLAAELVLGGFGMYRFVGMWHGFHDPGFAYSIEAANQNLMHYAHHAQRRVHLRDFDGLARVVGELQAPSASFVLRPEFESRMPFWHLQGLLWKKDFYRASDCLVAHSTVMAADMDWAPFSLRNGLVARGIAEEVMRRLSAGCLPASRVQWLRQVDDAASRGVGSLVAGRSSTAIAPALPSSRTTGPSG